MTAAEIYQLDGYRAIPPASELDIVLVVGSEDGEPIAKDDTGPTLQHVCKGNRPRRGGRRRWLR